MLHFFFTFSIALSRNVFYLLFFFCCKTRYLYLCINMIFLFEPGQGTGISLTWRRYEKIGIMDSQRELPTIFFLKIPFPTAAVLHALCQICLQIQFGNFPSPSFFVPLRYNTFKDKKWEDADGERGSRWHFDGEIVLDACNEFFFSLFARHTHTHTHTHTRRGKRKSERRGEPNRAARCRKPRKIH